MSLTVRGFGQWRETQQSVLWLILQKLCCPCKCWEFLLLVCAYCQPPSRSAPKLLSQSGLMLLVCQTALSFPHDDKRVNSISPFAHYKYFLPMSCELGAQMNPIHLLHPGASSAFYYNSRNNFQVSFCLPRSPGRNKHVLPYLRPVSSCWVATGDGNCYSKGDLQGSCFYFKQIAVCILGVVRRF